MKELQIDGIAGRSHLLIGERLAALAEHVPHPRPVIVTDTNVQKLYGHAFPDWPVIEIGTGEGQKTLATAADIYRQLMALEVDRTGFLVGIGGGIVCDITGFVASTYMRGIDFGFVATTLLAQVDASVGGKNGVNLDGYKNMVGVFNQPRFVICDPYLLDTLPEKERMCGFAEIVKHAAIADEAMLTYIEANQQRALAMAPEVMEQLVLESVVIKADIVNQDAREAGERRKLNFGHTYGHAIEKCSDLSHGEAVSAGMHVAAALSQHLGLLADSQADRLRQALTGLNLPLETNVDRQRVVEALGKDKKRAGQKIHFVLLEKLGAAVVQEMDIDELVRFYKHL